jgi:uncharacterized protein YwgA
MGELKKVLGYLKELGKRPRVDEFKDKLVIQKTVCLLELSGIKLGYAFSLYVRGPYSPSLTKELYDNKEMVNKLQTDYVPDAREKQLLHTIFDLSDGLDPVLLEIMSTYAYFIKELNYEEKIAITSLKKLKPFYSEGRIAVGVSKAKQLFFKPTEKEIEEMKKEFSGWQDVIISDQKY